MGVHQAMALIGNTKQATSDGKMVRLKPDRQLRPWLKFQGNGDLIKVLKFHVNSSETITETF